jgi:hypothetical protein
MMRRLPISINISPREIRRGTSIIELKLTNNGDQRLETLEVGLHSLDQSLIDVENPEKWVNSILPGETITVPFNISAHRSAMIHTRIFGYMGEERFEWQSPPIRVKVGEEAAELLSLLILGESSRKIGDTLEVEATLRALKNNVQVTIDFWVNTPREKYMKIGEITTSILQQGDTKHIIEFTPTEKGLYTVYIYLYEKSRQIDRQSDKVFIKEN